MTAQKTDHDDQIGHLSTHRAAFCPAHRGLAVPTKGEAYASIGFSSSASLLDSHYLLFYPLYLKEGPVWDALANASITLLPYMFFGSILTFLYISPVPFPLTLDSTLQHLFSPYACIPNSFQSDYTALTFIAGAQDVGVLSHIKMYVKPPTLLSSSPHSRCAACFFPTQQCASGEPLGGGIPQLRAHMGEGMAA